MPRCFRASEVRDRHHPASITWNTHVGLRCCPLYKCTHSDSRSGREILLGWEPPIWPIRFKASQSYQPSTTRSHRPNTVSTNGWFSESNIQIAVTLILFEKVVIDEPAKQIMIARSKWFIDSRSAVMNIHRHERDWIVAMNDWLNEWMIINRGGRSERR